MLINAFIDISIDILIDISIHMFITFISIDILSDKEGGGRKGREEEGKGVDHSLKSHNPTQRMGNEHDRVLLYLPLVRKAALGRGKRSSMSTCLAHDPGRLP